MPEMDGYEATRRIRDASSAVADHGIPIIAMTANAMKGDRERCLEAGMDDYISKPIDRQELVEAIERRLEGRAARETPLPAPPASSGEAPSEKVFDGSRLLDTLSGDEEIFRTVLGGFLEDAPRQIDALKEAMSDRDAARIRRQAHSLKGASGNVGALTMQKVAAQIEEAGESADLDEAGSLIQAIEREFGRLEEAVASHLLQPAR